LNAGLTGHGDLHGNAMEDAAHLWLMTGGLALGLAYGALVQRTRFCMMAAVSNLMLMRDYRHVHAYLAAAAVAVMGTQWLESAGWVAVAESGYRGGRIDWVGALLGGTVFGFGTTLAGGCAGRTAVSASEGNLGGLLALLAFALSATITQFGVLEPLRARLAEVTAVQIPAGDASLAVVLGLPPQSLAAAVGLACLAVILVTGRALRSGALLGAGASIGALVVAGWWITGHPAEGDFACVRPGSLTFSGPLARATLYLATASSSGADFDVALIAGVMAGAFGSAVVTRTFHWVPPEATRAGRYLLGGTLMGIGAIFAGGCNIGQGLTGLSTLSLKSFLALAAIVAGMVLGVAWLQRNE
jgi:uncharacterized protein